MNDVGITWLWGSPRENNCRVSNWRMRWPPDITTQGDKSKKNFFQNSKWTMICIHFCNILLKLHILCTMFIEKSTQFRLEKVRYHNTIPITVHSNSDIVLFKNEIWIQHIKLKNGTSNWHFGAMDWSLVKFTPLLKILLFYYVWKVEMSHLKTSKHPWVMRSWFQLDLTFQMRSWHKLYGFQELSYSSSVITIL